MINFIKNNVDHITLIFVASATIMISLVFGITGFAIIVFPATLPGLECLLFPPVAVLVRDVAPVDIIKSVVRVVHVSYRFGHPSADCLTGVQSYCPERYRDVSDTTGGDSGQVSGVLSGQVSNRVSDNCPDNALDTTLDRVAAG